MGFPAKHSSAGPAPGHFTVPTRFQNLLCTLALFRANFVKFALSHRRPVLKPNLPLFVKDARHLSPSSIATFLQELGEMNKTTTSQLAGEHLSPQYTIWQLFCQNVSIQKPLETFSGFVCSTSIYMEILFSYFSLGTPYSRTLFFCAANLGSAGSSCRTKGSS